jgi:hypothetical protein
MADKELGELAAALRNSVALQALITAGGADLATYGARLAIPLGLGGAAGSLATDENFWNFAAGLKLLTSEGMGAAYLYQEIPIVSSEVDIDGATFWGGLVTAAEATVDIASATGLNSFPRFLELFASGQETTFTSTAIFDTTINFTFPLVIPDGERRVLVITNVSGDNRALLIGGGSDGGGDLVDDTSPQLGGTLDMNSNNILAGAATITPTEMSYLDGVTSAIQTQLDAMIAQGVTDFTIYAHEMTGAVTAGASPVFAETATNDKMLVGWAFPTASDAFAHFDIKLPKKYNNGTFTFQVHWYHVTSNATATVTWCFELQAIGNAEALDGSWGTAVRVVDDGATAMTRYVSDATGAVTAANTPANGKTIAGRLSRDVDGNGTAGNDDLAQDAIVTHISGTYTSNAATDA